MPKLPNISTKVRWNSYCEETTKANHPATSSVGSVLSCRIYWRSEKTHQRLGCSKMNRSEKTQSAAFTYLAVRVLRPVYPIATDMWEVFASRSRICFCIHMNSLHTSPQTIVTQTTMIFGNCNRHTDETSFVETLPPTRRHTTSSICLSPIGRPSKPRNCDSIKNGKGPPFGIRRVHRFGLRLLFDPPEPQTMEKHSESRLFYHLHLLSS